MRSRLQQSGLELPRVAVAHLVRRILATQLVSQPRLINEVADLLGHRSIDTTAIYEGGAAAACRCQAATLRVLARYVEAEQLDSPLTPALVLNFVLL